MNTIVILDRTLDRIGRGLLVLSALLVLAMFCSVLFGAFARVALPKSPSWPDPVTEYALMLATVFAAPRLMREGGHVVVDALLRTVSRKTRKRMELVGYSIAILAALIMASIAFVVSIEAIANNYTDVRSIKIPLVTLTAPISLCFALTSLECLRHFVLISRSHPREENV